jgi:hypothetical protein
MTTAPFTAPSTAPEPLIRVEKGSVDPAELAALTAVLLHRGAYDVCADEGQASAPCWSRAGTRHATGSALSWRAAHIRDAARRPWQG